jgi:hypothetical protein
MLKLSISRPLFSTKADADRAGCTVGQGPRPPDAVDASGHPRSGRAAAAIVKTVSRVGLERHPGASRCPWSQ